MQIDNEFTVSVPIEQAWAVLTDLQAIAPCMPGAQLTGVEGDVYAGKVKVKVGPVTSEYAGTARFAEKDGSGYHAVIDAKGKDVRGAGNASAAISAHLRSDGAGTVVSVSTDLKISGRIAQFGTGMIKEVSAKLLGQFVECLEGKLAAMPADRTPAATPGTPTPGTPAVPGTAQVPGTGGAVEASVPAGTAGAQRGMASPAMVAAGRTGPAAVDGASLPGSAIAAEPPPLDLMSVAGSSIYKRAVPLIALVIVVVGLVIYFAAR